VPGRIAPVREVASDGQHTIRPAACRTGHHP